jgi:hypothetical protein
VCSKFFAREAAGALDARHSLRPLISKGGLFMHNSGAFASREGGCSSVATNFVIPGRPKGEPGIHPATSLVEKWIL